MKTSQAKTPLILDYKDSPVLREIAHPVPVKDIRSKKIQDLIRAMNRALDQEEDGVAIAAPQVGAAVRIFIIKGSVLSMKRNGRHLEKPETATPPAPNMVFINPEITKLSKKKQEMEEGCLSVRWLYGQVLRSEKATVKARDEHGKFFTKGASGLLAQAFQHEIDHLDGILFIDKAQNLENVPPRTHEEPEH